MAPKRTKKPDVQGVGKKRTKRESSDDSALDLERVLRRLRALRESRRTEVAKRARSVKDLNLERDVCEVEELKDEKVVSRISELFLEIAWQVLSGGDVSFSVPSRAASNQYYVKELDRIVLMDKVTHRNLNSLSTARKTAITARVLELCRELCLKGIHATKRDIFYTDVKLFVKQSESDECLEDCASLVRCTRTSLNVVASERGVIVGRVSFRDDGDLIDCTRMGVGGKAIPSAIDRVTDIQSDAEFILLIEKDAAFMRLAEDRFYNRYPCVLLTAKGQPDVSTRLMLRKLVEETHLPVLALVDSDPYGLKIISVYMSGSKNMSYDSANLTTPNILWLGVRPSDLDRFHIPEQCRLPMTDADIKTGKELLKEEFVKKNPRWVAELEMMIRRKEKAEIQALSSFGFQFLTEVYLPKKDQVGRLDLERSMKLVWYKC